MKVWYGMVRRTSGREMLGTGTRRYVYCVKIMGFLFLEIEVGVIDG